MDSPTASATAPLLPDKRPSRSGLTLVEILIAGFILTVVMVPISQLMFSRTTHSRVGRDRTTAVNLAANVMSQLLEKVPYTAIKPGEGPTAGTDTMASGIESAGRFAAMQQALLDGDWEKLVDDDLGKPGRIVKREGTPFEVILFAGHYPDVESRDATSGFNAPKIEEEISFSYFRNPYVPVTEDTRRAITLASGSGVPYDATGSTVPGVPDTAVHDPRFRPGWPQSPGSQDADGRFQVTHDNFNRTPSREWPRHSLDLSDFRETSAFMKLVLGIRWKTPGAGFQHSGESKTSKEFWLVSFKAKLEE